MEKEEKTILAYEGMALNEEQISALKKVESALNELGELGVSLVLNQDTYEFSAINTNHLVGCDYEFDYELTDEQKEKVILDPFKFGDYGTIICPREIYLPAWDFVMVVDDLKTE